MRKLLTKNSFLFSEFKTQFKWKQGDVVNNFKVLSITHQKDLNYRIHHLAHQITNTQWYHIQNEDTNNCFATIIKTLIENNKGTPHILQHLACCGSQKFPIRDPFFNMLKRSLNTYMNAWTGEDFTCYPFSSANQKDYQNLLKVYLDMVFQPKLDYYDFLQQGWRYQIENNKIQYKGIVLNEMKGSYQSPDNNLFIQLSKNLFGNTPYVYNTGGEPSQIVKLNYAQLRQLHQRFYHPSNLKFYSYGSFNILPNIRYINEEYLANKKVLTNTINFNFNPKVLKKQSIIYTKNEENQIALSYFIGLLDKVDKIQIDALSLLTYLLFETNQADMYEQLIEKGVGESFGYQIGLSPNKLVTFSFSLKGIDQNLSQSQFKTIIQNSLKNLSKTQFSKQRIQQAFHQFRINYLIKKKNNGIKLLEHLLIPINHECDINQMLDLMNSLQILQRKVLHEDPDFLGKLIQKYFLNNDHNSSVLQLHNQNQTQKILEPPLNRQISDQKIIQDQNQLKKRQQTIVSNEILPTLQLEDIKKNEKINIYQQKIANFDINWINIDKGVNHFKVMFRLENLEPEMIDSLSLWSYAFNKGLSTKNRSYKNLSKQLSLYGTNFYVSVDYSPLSKQFFFIFNISSLENNTQKALQILKQTIMDIRFEEENMKTIFKSFKNDLNNDLINNPLNYAKSIASANVNEIAYHKQVFRQSKFALKYIDEYVQGKNCLQNFNKIHDIFRNCQNISLIFHSGQQNVLNHKSIFTQQFKTKSSILSKSSKQLFVPQFKSITYKNNYDVNCCVQAYKGQLPYSIQSSHLILFLSLLQQKYLHRQIREKGGAYGSGARQLSSGSVFLFSYLDPECEKTFNVFNNSIENLLNDKDIDLRNLKQAKLSYFSKFDEPLVQHQKGLSEIIQKLSYQDREKYRQSIIKANIDQIKEAGQKYLRKSNYSRVVFGKDVPSNFSQQLIKLNL